MIDTKKQINRSLQLPLVEITYRVIGTWRAHTGLIKSMFLSKNRDREALVDEAMEFLNWK